jgi:hypothetical protein
MFDLVIHRIILVFQNIPCSPLRQSAIFNRYSSIERVSEAHGSKVPSSGQLAERSIIVLIPGLACHASQVRCRVPIQRMLQRSPLDLWEGMWHSHSFGAFGTGLTISRIDRGIRSLPGRQAWLHFVQDDREQKGKLLIVIPREVRHRRTTRDLMTISCIVSWSWHQIAASHSSSHSLDRKNRLIKGY